MNELLKRLRRELEEKRGKLNDLVAASEREERDLTPDEGTTLDALTADITALTDRVAKLEQVLADSEADAASNRGTGRRSNPIGSGPAIHTDRTPFSFTRAIRRAADGQLDGLEGEVSQEIAKRTGRQPKGFFLPIGNDPEIRAMMNRGRPERRDMTTTTGAGLIFNESEGTLIELLRSQLVIRELGATVLSDMQGLFAIPRQTGSGTVYWLGEGVSATPSNQTYDQVAFSPKVALAATGLTRLLLNQSSLDSEQLTKNDLAETIAREIDRVAINGSGGTQPLGIAQRPGIQTKSAGLAIGTNGGPLTWAKIVAMETQVAGYNANRGKLAYLMNPAMRGALKTTPKIGSTFPTFLWEDGASDGVGELNGYKAMVSTIVPGNNAKGSGTNLSTVIFGNWKDLVLAIWEGMDTLVNPYSPQLSGGVVISMEMSVDTQVRHEESFSLISDAALA
jgi:HK97 family phage major capsid protein